VVKRILRTLIVIGILLTGILIVRVVLYSEEDALRGLLRKVEVSLEKEDTKGFMECISLEFSSPKFGINYYLLGRLLDNLFRDWQEIKVKIVVKDLQINGQEAKVSLEVTASAKEQRSGEKVGLYNEPGILHLKKDLGKWKIVEVDMERGEDWQSWRGLP